MQEEPSHIYPVIRAVLVTVVFLAIAIWSSIRALKRSEDPALLVFKWVLTLIIIVFMLWKVAPAAGGDAIGAIFGILTAAVCGVGLAGLWASSFIGVLGNRIGGIFDGGDREVEPEAYYSVAEAKRGRGQYQEAIAEIRKQLERFPTDVRGQFLLAEIQMENLKDLSAAQVTLQRFCNQPGHTPRNITYALNLLADWHLKYSQDREAARQELEKVVEKFPDTDLAHAARQRIAHLATTERMLEPHERQARVVPEGVNNVGLLASSAHLAPAEADPEKTTADLVEHLVLHPHDAEAREKLAILYTDHYQRPDLAADQLEQLIEVPNQTPKHVARWLNLMADLQVRGGADYDAVRKTLERIIQRDPNHSAASLARNRIEKLKLEFKGRGKNQDVKLGTYEQYVGLKQGRPE